MSWRPSLRKARLWIATLGALLLPAGGAALAHPHVWVDVRTQLLFDDAGKLTGFRHDWTFDEGYSSFAVMGLDTNADGTVSREELEPLARINVESLKEFDYYTFLVAGEETVALGDPIDYYADYADGRTALHFTLPLQAALDIRKQQAVSFRVYDPAFYIDFGYVAKDPVSLDAKAPSLCKADYTPPPAVEPTDPVGRGTLNLGQFSAADFNDEDATLPFANSPSNQINLVCDYQDKPKQ